MFSNVISGSVIGIDGYIIHVEVDVSDGMPAFDMVGYLGSEVREARERVRTSLKNLGYNIPAKKITVNLSPADIRKEGTAFDLPIAIAVLASFGYIPHKLLQKVLIIGELSLDGHINRVNGVLSVVNKAFQDGYEKCIVPFSNVDEAAVVKGIEIYGANTLLEVINFLNGTIELESRYIDLEYILKNENYKIEEDFCEIKGQDLAKRAIEVAASGMHNILMIGSPGSGKTMLARRLPSILPELTLEESLEITKIYSVSGMLSEGKSLIIKRPFRAPHHTISDIALVGGGRYARPGEMSLANKGVLFLDELPEFSRSALEVMRQPMEDKKVTISRINHISTFPTDYVLVASMNPCPCGYYPDYNKCNCNQNKIKRYINKISGPLLDRIDICVEVSAISYTDLDQESVSEKSSIIKQRVLNAQNIQKLRYKNEGIFFNSQLSNSQIEKYCALRKKEKKILNKAFEKLELSARAYYRILRVARTIADLDNQEDIQEIHIIEAIKYRSLDGKYWRW